VRHHFSRIFGEKEAQEARYEKWIIAGAVSRKFRDQLKVQGVCIRLFRNFILNDVLPSIKRWTSEEKRPKQFNTLPGDKWLLWQLDMLQRRDLLVASSAADGVEECAKNG
jgi:hypothetical protein